MLRILKWIFLIWLGLSVLSAPIWGRLAHQVWVYNPMIMPSPPDEPADKSEARAQDIDYLRELLNYDRSFSDAAKEAFTTSLDTLDTTAAGMSDPAFYLAVSKAVALADNGHTNASIWPVASEFNAIGVKFYWFEDGLYIVRAHSEYADIIGTRLVAIGGMPIEDVANKLKIYRGGNDPWRRHFIPAMIESPDILYAAGITNSSETVTFSLEMENGDIKDVRFPGFLPATVDEARYRDPSQTLWPQPLENENENWQWTLNFDNGNTPLYLSDPGTPTYTSLPDNGLYIRTQGGFGTAEQSIQDFFKEALSETEDGSLDYLVVDFRTNDGGDYTRSIDFAKTAPTKIKDGGRLYLLVGPETFSAAIVTVAMLKYYGAEKSIIVGSPMGDRPQFWAETGRTFRLPNSGYRINYATGYHDWENGCEGIKYCFTQNLIHGVPAGSLEPRMQIWPTYADYATGQDIVMDWVISDQAAR
ncbi:MAG: hypothetical protein AAGA69_02575 [Pseudomonadota bacterium]